MKVESRGGRISIVELVGSCSVGRNHMANDIE